MTSNQNYNITPQKPLSSGFDKHSTAKDILKGIDLSNKICIVTGGYSGIGLETTRALAEAGATVVVPARSMDKARDALLDIPTCGIGRA
ncbi:SDR family NAD(P)-dependent oxidoreductase [Paenibacillus sp. Root52]|uniref:SDR family NAD(P)-dependent oxidoreductase n=1 Tax=Paenibacillus sp. Root52 TaxID=1736552 RepID=UPI0026BB6E3E